jgi:hypothetical protein
MKNFATIKKQFKIHTKGLEVVSMMLKIKIFVMIIVDLFKLMKNNLGDA